MPDVKDCITDEMWEEAMHGINEYYKQITETKEKLKRELKGLINTRKVWEFMNGGHDSWEAIGVYEASIYQAFDYYYSKVLPHLKINDEKHRTIKLHWQKSYKYDTGTNHIFIIQWNPCEDSYHGYIAFPLIDRRYFLASYSA